MNLNKRIKEVDRLLIEITTNSEKNTDAYLNELFISICTALNIEKENPIQDLFDRKNSTIAKNFVAVCLLRIICKSHEIIWERKELRVKSFALFDEQFQADIYRTAKVIPNDENHVKLSKLQSVENLFLEDFSRIVKSIVSIETALKVRHNYMRAINSPNNRAFITNFIDGSIISEERLGEIFECLKDYIEANVTKKLDSYDKLRYIFTSFLSYAKENNRSEYSNKVIFEPFEKIYLAVKEDFEKNDTIKPTQLTIRKVNKKYPFHIKDKPLELKFEIINSGPGFAFDVYTEILEIDKEIQLETDIVPSGTLEPNNYEIFFKAKAIDIIKSKPNLIGQLSWKNFNSGRQHIDFDFELDAQRADLDWDSLKLKQPYSLEAVENEDELVGRKDVLDIIYAKLLSPKIESSIIYGQKRVGKTSLARTIQSRIDSNDNYLSIFIGTGGLDKTSPDKFIKTLGEKIVRKISNHPLLRVIEKPRFESSLEPLIRYFEEISYVNSELRFVIILDEFDEIPIQLYPYTTLGDSFFHNLRSISGEDGGGRIGFLLVGGENMHLIMQNTDKLNKFDPFRVDYFDKTTHWNEFRELISRPVMDWFEFHDDAINMIYDNTEGNPFYTKYICKRMYRKMCDTRNAYISKDEIDDAIRQSIDDMETINVNHFWSDGIRVEDSAKRDLIETQRRKFLIAFSEIGRCNKNICKSDFKRINLAKELAINELFESFYNRKIIIEENEVLRIKPKLFEKWLIEKGHQILRSSFSDEEALDALKNKESNAYVQDSEILTLSKKWRSYRGSEISVPQIRSWLNQFEDNIERRLMYHILNALKFYNEQTIREKLRIIHDSIRSEVVHTLKEKERVRRDILLSSFGEISKSGSSYARIYASENNITVHNVSSFENIPTALLKNTSIKAIVFIDDIIASGDTVIEHLKKLNKLCGKLLEEREIFVVVGAICGFSVGIDNIEETIKSFGFKIKYKICDFLTVADQCFSEESKIFDSDADRERAKSIAVKYGRRLQKRQPLGYNDSQLAVVFHDNCPNNTLPIIWSKSSNDEWTPLFMRN